MKRRFALLSALLALMLGGCYVPSPKPGKTETLSQQVGLADAKSVSASITIGVGKLKLAGGADSLERQPPKRARVAARAPSTSSGAYVLHLP